MCSGINRERYTTPPQNYAHLPMKWAASRSDVWYTVWWYYTHHAHYTSFESINHNYDTNTRLMAKKISADIVFSEKVNSKLSINGVRWRWRRRQRRRRRQRWWWWFVEYTIHMEICMPFKICSVLSEPIYLQSKNSNGDRENERMNTHTCKHTHILICAK